MVTITTFQRNCLAEEVKPVELSADQHTDAVLLCMEEKDFLSIGHFVVSEWCFLKGHFKTFA
jgi:hypothetical protein